MSKYSTTINLEVEADNEESAIEKMYEKSKPQG
jgi:ribosomal protein L20A (L18A)